MANYTKLERRLYLVLRIIMAVSLIFSLLEKNYFMAFLTVGVLVMFSLPFFVAKKYRVYIPPEVNIFTLIFIFSAVFLGWVQDYYIRFWWWNTMLHTFSGFLLGIFGYLLVFYLNKTSEAEVKMNLVFVSLFAFFFAIGLGALWEIFEFIVDLVFKSSMQPSLFDTMVDLIVDTLGAGVVSISGYFYFKRKKSFLRSV